MKSIALFSTSTRQGSYNQKMIDLAAYKLQQGGLSKPDKIFLKDYELPLFQPDLPFPLALTSLYERLMMSEGWVISACEYNHSFSPLIKNTLDWLSLVNKGGLFLGKKIWLMSASPGSFGGVKGLGHLHSVLWKLGATVLASPLSLPYAHEAFDDSGFFKEDAYSQRMDKGLISLLAAINSEPS